MIKAIITDFDGTLVDTFEANYLAYKHVLNNLGIELTRESYRACFGLRFNEFMEHIGVKNITLKDQIKKEKTKIYPLYFDKLSLNYPLLNFLLFMKHNGVKIAIASTARRENLINVLNYFDIVDGTASAEEVGTYTVTVELKDEYKTNYYINDIEYVEGVDFEYNADRTQITYTWKIVE